MDGITEMALTAVLTDLITGGTVKDALEEIDNLLLFPEKISKKQGKQLTFNSGSSKQLDELLVIISKRKEKYSKHQTELFKKVTQAKKMKDIKSTSLGEAAVDTYRIRIEELDNIEEIIKGLKGDS